MFLYILVSVYISVGFFLTLQNFGAGGNIIPNHTPSLVNTPKITFVCLGTYKFSVIDFITCVTLNFINNTFVYFFMLYMLTTIFKLTFD